ncbi:MAG: hypothetical protein U0228_01620 [Myxococcaceae bacterium]
MSLPLISLALVLAYDDPSTPADKSAQIEIDTQKAQAEVQAKYGNRKLSEMTSDERKQMAKDQAAAEKAVFEKAGIDPKQWSLEQSKRSRDELNKQNAAVAALKEKAKQDAAKKAKGDDPNKEVQVQRGISEDNPVVLDEKENEDGTVSVEKGLPNDANSDSAAAQEQDSIQNGGGGATDAPAKSSSSSGGSKSGGGKGGGKGGGHKK